MDGVSAKRVGGASLPAGVESTYLHTDDFGQLHYNGDRNVALQPAMDQSIDRLQ